MANEKRGGKKSYIALTKAKAFQKHNQSPVMIPKRHHHTWSVVVGVGTLG